MEFANIVQTNVNYTYKILINNLTSLKLMYPFIEIGYIGNSVLGKPIPYIRLGKGKKEVFYNGAFHANEWITAPVLMKFVEDYCIKYLTGKKLLDYSAEKLYENVSLYIVPMVNPDGVDLVTGSIQNVDNSYKNAEKIANNFPQIPFPSGWKANIEGVDLKTYQPVCKVL